MLLRHKETRTRLSKRLRLSRQRSARTSQPIMLRVKPRLFC